MVIVKDVKTENLQNNLQVNDKNKAQDDPELSQCKTMLISGLFGSFIHTDSIINTFSTFSSLIDFE